MPVLITAPEGEVGRGLVARLAATGGQVRAYGPDLAVGELRRLGVICANGSLLDEGHLETALEQTHTVVHLGFDVLTEDPDRLVEEAATLVAAAVGANVRRIIAVTLPDGTGEDPLRRAARDVEELVAAAPCPTVVVRPSLVDTARLREALARTPLSGEALETAVAPLRADDLAAVLFQLDERRDVLDADHTVLAADGPATTDLRGYLRALGITPMSLVGRMVERLRSGAPLLGSSFPGSWTSGSEVDDAWEVTGLEPGPAPAREDGP